MRATGGAWWLTRTKQRLPRTCQAQSLVTLSWRLNVVIVLARKLNVVYCWPSLLLLLLALTFLIVVIVGSACDGRFRANVRSGLTKMSTNRSKSFQFCHLWQKISRILDFGSKADCLPGADTIPRRRSRTNLQCCTIGSRPRGLLLRGNPYCWPIVVGNPYCCSVVIVNNNNNKPPLTLQCSNTACHSSHKSQTHTTRDGHCVGGLCNAKKRLQHTGGATTAAKNKISAAKMQKKSTCGGSWRPVLPPAHGTAGAGTGSGVGAGAGAADSSGAGAGVGGTGA